MCPLAAGGGAGWATSPRRIPFVLVCAEGFTVTWAVMLPQTAFKGCQEKFVELDFGGRRSPAEGRRKRSSAPQKDF